MQIQRLLLAAAAAAFALSGASPDSIAPGRFETKLSTEQKASQALSRLTFGARPGDMQEVLKLGVEKWIELQLHPERIPENPTLDTRLQRLESIRLAVADLLTRYYPQYPPGFVQPPRPNDLLKQEQMRKIYNGTAEERREAILALDSDKRTQVLAVLPPNILEGLPDLKKEQTAAREMQQAERQMQMRRLHPPLRDLLEPEQVRIANNGTPEQRSALFASLDRDKLMKVAASLPPNAVADHPELRRAAMMSRNPQQVVIADLREAKLYRALYSTRQLEEVLADFWFNHFNVFEGKPQERPLIASYEREAIRPHVLGKFKDLLLATARHPAMLTYLDNWESMASEIFDIGPFAPPQYAPPGQRFGFGRQAHGLNENYGRELLELHTLGVDGGYTQQDVIAVARCFTGWTIRQPHQKPEFAFAAFMHDTAEKTVLGHTIPAGGGEQDGLQVIDILVHHPSTARFISTKLSRRFVADDPPPALVERMARVFTKTDGDLRAVIETMLLSREFFSQGAWQAKIKSPLEMVVSAVRALDANAADTFTLVQKVADMGEPLYGKEAPTGYKDTSEAWLSTANVMARIDFANALAGGKVAGVRVDNSRWAGDDPAAIARGLLNHDPSEQTRDAIDRGLQGGQGTREMIASLVLSSPEFQRR